MSDYMDFIRSKVRRAKPNGFNVDLNALPAKMKDWQKRATQWTLRLGRAAMFEDTGLGKTVQQLAWGEQVYLKTGQPVVLHTPLGVRWQTKSEAAKFGIGCEVAVVDTPEAVVDGINLINYEKLHLFDSSVFGGVVLDESSCLKNFTGKIKRQLCERYADTPYRLACTATPAPNDHMELGNHADFLGVMPSNEMLSRWFFNDTMNAGGYRLKGHAANDFWEWVTSWAICLARPSDIGGDDTGYNLPPMSVQRHVVHVPFDGAANGFLFDVAGISATNIHEEKRRTNAARASKSAELARINAEKGPVLIWCYTDYEADELKRQMPEAIEIRGSHKVEYKERNLSDFAKGNIPILITKPEIAGAGLNFQVCATQIFAGVSFSFEDYYQAVRRSFRFGQSKNVTVHIVVSEAESMIEKTIARKESDHLLMQSSMSSVMAQFGLSIEKERMRDGYQANEQIQLPNFLRGKQPCNA